MKQEIQKQAFVLYERGLRALARSVGKEDRKLAAEHLQEACKLYRKAGNKEKTGELEAIIVNLYKKKFPEGYEEKTPRGGLVKKFDDWMMFFKIGCFGFGGPMAVFSLLEDELVRRKRILTDRDFLEGAVLGDILPGPVTMDIVTYTGYKLKRWSGALVSTLVFILPSFVIMLVLAMYYDTYTATPRVAVLLKCLGAAVTALILSVGLKLCKAEMKGRRETGILIFALVSALVFNLDMLVIVGLSGLAGILIYRDDDDWGARNAPNAERGIGELET